MLNDDDKREIQEMIDKAIFKAVEYQTRKRGDTPTDDLQLTPRKYVNMYGSIAGRPQASIVGQQYFATDASLMAGIGGPIFRGPGGCWISGTGSIVA